MQKKVRALLESNNVLDIILGLSMCKISEINEIVKLSPKWVIDNTSIKFIYFNTEDLEYHLNYYGKFFIYPSFGKSSARFRENSEWYYINLKNG